MGEATGGVREEQERRVVVLTRLKKKRVLTRAATSDSCRIQETESQKLVLSVPKSAVPKSSRHRADLKHFQRRTASSRTRVIMPVVLERDTATVLMLGMQFLQLAHAYLESMGAPESQLPAKAASMCLLQKLSSLVPSDKRDDLKTLTHATIGSVENLENLVVAFNTPPTQSESATAAAAVRGDGRASSREIKRLSPDSAASYVSCPRHHEPEAGADQHRARAKRARIGRARDRAPLGGGVQRRELRHRAEPHREGARRAAARGARRG